MDESSISSMSDGNICKLNMQTAHKRPHFTIEWRQLTYCHQERSSLLGSCFAREQPHEGGGHRSKKLILNALDGCFKSGQLSAILGPSGAGKSTFLSALFGNKQESAFGQTKVTWFEDCQHHVPIDSHIKQRPIRIAFLPQQDHLLNHLRVHETLMFASKIKNASRLQEMKLKSKDRERFHKQNVRRVAKMLKLVDCLQTRCGQLSGGQYKRVSIGQELLSEPDVIILDEPTSGLDAMTCLTTVRTLKSIATKHPISIILTIHQPDIDVFNLFDHIYVIAQGGRAIYEGPPGGVVETLARADLHMPSSSYNPARFIVENAFIAPPESGESGPASKQSGDEATVFSSDDEEEEVDAEAYEEEEEVYVETREHLGTCDGDEENGGKSKELVREKARRNKRTGDGEQHESNVLKRSLLSLTDAMAGKDSPLKQTIVNLSPIGAQKLRESGRKPLLNFGGVKTSDGKLISSNQLGLSDKYRLNKRRDYEKDQLERLNLLKRLNEIQKSKYYPSILAPPTKQSHTALCSELSTISDTASEFSNSDLASRQRRPTSVNSKTSEHEHSSSVTFAASQPQGHNFIVNLTIDSRSEHNESLLQNKEGSRVSTETSGVGSTISYGNSSSCTSNTNSLRTTSGLSSFSNQSGSGKLKRRFDKRLSAKHNNSKQKDYPVYYHSFLLTHRTWLSIVRDPIFFGIQFCMHTTIPILLAFIFGSQQEEGCPIIGQFDLVDFAYKQNSNDFIRGTMQSIRQSMGNIGVIFFEMFVLSFAINCITALVFPLDMYVLSKEYRNGWYSLRSYFIGRTLADLPVPIALHSMAMTILYYMTGQPLEWWRFGAIIVIVIIASLVAQSVGLTIGALLMQSSQSAVLAAAGIVAPFFALSGFIVRIHTLPWVAQWAAQVSYLYHLLNGFIIMRYGFGRCHCDASDFEANDQHKVPHNLRTMASIWIGTYSNEYETVAQRLANGTAASAKTNVDPNIDLVDKLSGAFKMANSYGHRVESCNDALPYAMLDFNLRDCDIWASCLSLLAMLLITRLITFSAIYYKIRSFA